MAPHAAAVDVTVTSLLNSTIIMGVGLYTQVLLQEQLNSTLKMTRNVENWAGSVFHWWVESHGAWCPMALKAISQLGHSWECL